jgi:hypothetical protein
MEQVFLSEMERNPAAKKIFFFQKQEGSSKKSSR